MRTKSRMNESSPLDAQTAYLDKGLFGTFGSNGELHAKNDVPPHRIPKGHHREAKEEEERRIFLA